LDLVGLGPTLRFYSRIEVLDSASGELAQLGIKVKKNAG